MVLATKAIGVRVFLFAVDIIDVVYKLKFDLSFSLAYLSRVCFVCSLKNKYLKFNKIYNILFIYIYIGIISVAIFLNKNIKNSFNKNI